MRFDENSFHDTSVHVSDEFLLEIQVLLITETASRIQRRLVEYSIVTDLPVV